MFRVVSDEIWADGWLVARINRNLPATVREVLERRLKADYQKVQPVEQEDDDAAYHRPIQPKEMDGWG